LAVAQFFRIARAANTSRIAEARGRDRRHRHRRTYPRRNVSTEPAAAHPALKHSTKSGQLQRQPARLQCPPNADTRRPPNPRTAAPQHRASRTG